MATSTLQLQPIAGGAIPRPLPRCASCDNTAGDKYPGSLYCGVCRPDPHPAIAGGAGTDAEIVRLTTEIDSQAATIDRLKAELRATEQAHARNWLRRYDLQRSEA